MAESLMRLRHRRHRPKRLLSLAPAGLLGCLVLTLLVAGCREEVPTARADLVQKLYDGRDHIRIEGARELGKNANRLESAELARAARGASIPVRRAIATALGEAKAPEAVDYLGTFLRDPDDSVRAAAVLALARRTETKAHGYLLSAYSGGGPETRAAIASLGPELLTAAVKDEAQSRIDRYTRPRPADGCCAWKRDDADGCSKCPPQVRADGLVQLGVHGTERATAELALRLLDPFALYAAAAAEGLGLSGDVKHADALLEAARSGRPDVAVAAGIALGRLQQDSASEALASLLPDSTPERASTLLDALEHLFLTDAAREALCGTALTSPVPEIAVRALLLAKDTCEVRAGPVPAGEGDDVLARMEVLALAGVSDTAWLSRAREWLTHDDARLAATAAHYLGAAGSAADGKRLLEVAESERQTLVQARLARNRLREARRLRSRHPAADLPQLTTLFPDIQERLEQEEKKGNALAELLRDRDTTVDVHHTEPRPGALTLIHWAAIGAARRGVDASELGARLLDDESAQLRQTAVMVADLLGPEGDDLRDMLRRDEDRAVRVSMALSDLDSDRPGAVDRLKALLDSATDPGERINLVEALTPVAAQARDTLLAAARRNDSASPLAMRLLAGVDGPLDTQLVDIARSQLADPLGFGAVESLSLLDRLDGDDVVQALVGATVHPMGHVREYALDLLARRGACPSTAVALKHDFERRVRDAAVRVTEVCAERRDEGAGGGG